MIEKDLWERLWDYDPNGLIVFDHDNHIQIVNAAFCSMFKVEEQDVLGKHAAEIFDDLSSLNEVRETGTSIKGREKEYPRYGLYVRHVLFTVGDQGLIACIMIDLTSERQRNEELLRMKKDLITQVNKVIDKQMSIAQEIASLLGETTAEAKVGLLKIRNMLNEEFK